MFRRVYLHETGVGVGYFVLNSVLDPVPDPNFYPYSATLWIRIQIGSVFGNYVEFRYKFGLIQDPDSNSMYLDQQQWWHVM